MVTGSRHGRRSLPKHLLLEPPILLSIQHHLHHLLHHLQLFHAHLSPMTSVTFMPCRCPPAESGCPRCRMPVHAYNSTDHRKADNIMGGSRASLPTAGAAFSMTMVMLTPSISAVTHENISLRRTGILLCKSQTSLLSSPRCSQITTTSSSCDTAAGISQLRHARAYDVE